MIKSIPKGKLIDDFIKKKSTANIIRETLLYTTKVLNDNKIPYWIDFGTLLGAIRNGKVIEWDDDADVCVDEKYRMKIIEIFQKIKITDYY